MPESPKPTLTQVTGHKSLEAWGALYNLQAAQQVGGCPFQGPLS